MKRFKNDRGFKPRGQGRAKDRLSALNVRPSKARGQNFVIDPAIIHEVISFGKPQADETLVEIGPGLGALTSELIKVGKLKAIEIEDKFCVALSQKYTEIELINRDVREVDLAELGSELVVFGNVPYSISTDIVFHLVAFKDVVKRAVLMLQREFAERLAASPGGKDYGVLSISTQLSANVHLGPGIEGTAFHPPAAVQSRLVELTFPKAPRYQVEDLFWLKRVVSASFAMRRKMLKNTLKASQIVPGDVVDRAFLETGIEPTRRPETLSIPEFIRLSEALKVE